MPYDASKDLVLCSVEAISNDSDKRGIVISLRQYDGGEKKIQLTRFGTKKSGERYYRPNVGRITQAEMNQIIAAYSSFRV